MVLDDGFILELFNYTHHLDIPKRSTELSTDLPVVGTKHLGLRVKSAEKALSDLTSKGLVAKNQEITQGRTGPRYFFLKDPDGILVEISQDDRIKR